MVSLNVPSVVPGVFAGHEDNAAVATPLPSVGEEWKTLQVASYVEPQAQEMSRDLSPPVLEPLYLPCLPKFCCHLWVDDDLKEYKRETLAYWNRMKASGQTPDPPMMKNWEKYERCCCIKDRHFTGTFLRRYKIHLDLYFSYYEHRFKAAKLAREHDGSNVLSAQEVTDNTRLELVRIVKWRLARSDPEDADKFQFIPNKLENSFLHHMEKIFQIWEKDPDVPNPGMPKANWFQIDWLVVYEGNAVWTQWTNEINNRAMYLWYVQRLYPVQQGGDPETIKELKKGKKKHLDAAVKWARKAHARARELEEERAARAQANSRDRGWYNDNSFDNSFNNSRAF